ncbi:MAG: nucleotide exchange factor GrpE [Mycoplasmatales bacterium]
MSNKEEITKEEIVSEAEIKEEEIVSEAEIKEERTEKETDDVSQTEEKTKTVSEQEYLQLQEKYKKVETSYQRLLADFENSKRRNAQEVMEAKTKGKIEVFEKLLDIIDNFERSMAFDIQTEEFKTGIEMVHKMFSERLQATGLQEVNTEGILDPNKHQAIMVEEDAKKENDEILEVLQKGYSVEEKVIRPAMVKVNKK